MVILVFVCIFSSINVIIIQICIIYDSDLKSLLLLQIESCKNFYNELIRMC